MSDFWTVILRHYEHGIINSGRQPQFLVLLAFLLTFVAVRTITHAIRAGRGRHLFRNLSSGDTHVHHLVWGILLLLVTGYLALAFDPTAAREPLAVLFGIGAALTLDEFALWLNLKDVYWTSEGRRSIDAVVITAALFGLGLIGFRFWVNLGLEIGRLVGSIDK